MSFFESNSAIIREQYPGLLEEITRAGDDILAPEDMRIETAASGDPALTIRGLHVHSKRDPAREGRRLAETVSAGGAHTGPVIILGFGLGYAACAAVELAGDRPLVIVEKYRNLLLKALELRDLSNLFLKGKIAFVLGGSGEGVTRALYLLASGADEKAAPAVIRSRALVNLDGEWYEAVEGRIRTWTMRDDVNMATLKKFGRRWVRNLSRNMSAIRDLPGISHIAGLAAGSAPSQMTPNSGNAVTDLPVFLAAAGPGLDRAGSLLPEIQKRCIVVAVDTSLRFLLKHGAAPDFALVVDPQYWNSRHLDRAVSARTRLVAESAVYPPVLRLPFRNLCLCGSLFPLGSFIEQRVDPKGPLGAGGSVATTAWDFARSLGATEIWIAGLDLAFPGLKTHFRGALFEEQSNAVSCRLSPAETWLVRALRDGHPFRAPSASGGQVLTDRRLSLYAAWFENRFSQFPGVRSRSFSADGLAIAGLETAAAENILALPCRRDEINARIEAAFTKLETDFFEPQAIRRRAERYEAAVSALLQGLEQIKSASERGAKIAEQALTRPVPAPEHNKILAKLDEVTKTIANSEVKEVAGFLFNPEELAEMNRAAVRSGGTDPLAAYLTASARLYRSLAEAADFNLREISLKSPAYRADTISTGRDNLS
ncbi:MAG: DUF115 domain-containing protein [Treponema sp.]|jgi:hypothetical protein|nr:DUF115 domain-containing protein [Treponema sp.]